jgi:hypothetical protein
MPDRLLKWQRTNLPSRPRDDYTGTDPVWPRLYARVYLSTSAVSERPWYWVLAETVTIGTGYEATVEAAVDAAETPPSGKQCTLMPASLRNIGGGGIDLSRADVRAAKPGGCLKLPRRERLSLRALMPSRRGIRSLAQCR